MIVTHARGGCVYVMSVLAIKKGAALMDDYNNNGMMPAANSDVSDETKQGLRRIGIVDRYLSRTEQAQTPNVPNDAYTSMMPGDNASGMPNGYGNMPDSPNMGNMPTMDMPNMAMPNMGMLNIDPSCMPGGLDTSNMGMQQPTGAVNRRNASAIDRSVSEQERLQQKTNNIYQKTANLQAQDAQLCQEMAQLMQRNNILMSEIYAMQNQIRMNPAMSTALLLQIQHKQTEYGRNSERWQTLRNRRMSLQSKVVEQNSMLMNNYQMYGQSKSRQAALERLTSLQQQGIVPAEVYYDAESGTLTYARATDGNVRKWLLWYLCKSEGLISYPEAVVQLIRMEEPLSAAKEGDDTCRHACLMNLLEIRHMPVNTAYYGEVKLAAPLLIDPQTMMAIDRITPTETVVEFAYCPQCAKVYYYFDNSENIY